MEKRDIVSELVSDHWVMRDLLKILADEDATSQRKHHALKRLAPWLKWHSVGEEKTVQAYGKLHRDTKVLAYEDGEEHANINGLLNKLSHTRNPALWTARVHLLTELVEHHLDEEEEEFFPLLRESLTAEESEKMAKRYRALTESLDPDRPQADPGILGWLSSRPNPNESIFL